MNYTDALLVIQFADRDTLWIADLWLDVLHEQDERRRADDARCLAILEQVVIARRAREVA